jgi:hypothetical protein
LSKLPLFCPGKNTGSRLKPTGFSMEEASEKLALRKRYAFYRASSASQE